MEANQNYYSKRRHRICNIGMMERALAEVWPTIEKERRLNLNARRLDACIKNKGGSTKY